VSDFLNSPLGIVLGTILGMTVPWLLIGPLWWWSSRRDQCRWQRGEAARQRQWAEEDRRQALQQQLREMERQIWRESLPEWQREALAEADRQRVAIQQEARRRLGLPEDEG
jgi:hypothetical protein